MDIAQIETENEKHILQLKTSRAEIKEKDALIEIKMNQLKVLESKMDNLKAELKSAQMKNNSNVLVTDDKTAKLVTDIEKLKEKFRREAENWAKEKRRLESKVRHINKSNSSNISTQSSQQTPENASDTRLVFILNVFCDKISMIISVKYEQYRMIT